MGKQLLEYTATLFRMLRRVRDGTLQRRTMLWRMDEVLLLEKARVCADEKAARTVRELLHLWKALWTFMHHEDVPVTNTHHDERLLRHAVCMRKVSFGTKEAGGNNLAILLV